MENLQDRVVVVTGGSRGIGQAIARACAEDGAQVAIIGRDRAALQQAVRQLRGRPISLAADVTRPADVHRVFTLLRKQFGRIDILVNSAGVFTFKPFVKTTLSEWRRTIETNLTGLFLAIQAALPLLEMGRNAHIVNVLSISSRTAFENCSAYSAAKFGALGFTRVLAKELRPKKIRVTAILPGPTNTRMIEGFGFPVERDEIIQPEDVAAAVLGALHTQPRATVEEVLITPSKGSL